MVERGSTHHSGRVDDALAEEVEPLVRSGHESRAEDERLHEPPADDEPTPDARIAGGRGVATPARAELADQSSDGVLDIDEIEARSQLAASLRPSAFPADRDTLLAVAEEQHAEPDIVEALATLPGDIRFVNVQQVWEMLGGEREQRDGGGAVVAPAAPPATTEEPVEVEIEIELELEADDARTAALDDLERGALDAPPASPGAPWWMGAVRTGIGLATLPLRVGASALRFVNDRLRR